MKLRCRTGQLAIQSPPAYLRATNRRYQVSLALPCRMDDEVRRDIPSALNELPGDSIDQWALDMEAEYQYPENDTDFPFEDDEAAGALSGAVRVGNLIHHTILRVNAD